MRQSQAGGRDFQSDLHPSAPLRDQSQHLSWAAGYISS